MKRIKRVLLIILCLALLVSMCVPALAVGESNSHGIVFSVTLDTPEITPSDTEQLVVMRLNASEPVEVDGIGFSVTWEAPLSIVSITGGDEIGDYNEAVTNTNTGAAYWNSSSGENVSGVTELAVITFLVPAGTEPGTYEVGVKNLQLTKDYGEDIWEDTAYAAVSLVIRESVATAGYMSSIRAAKTDVEEGETVPINIAVSHSTDSTFAAGEIVLIYDDSYLEFNKAASGLGAAAVKVESGMLTLEDYGEDKNFGTAVYVLAFDALKEGAAMITMTSAAFVDKLGAEKSNLVAASISPDTASISINRKTHAVTLPDIFTGDKTAADGEAYTFYVADGDNYDYGTVTATVDGVSVAVTDNKDGSYTVESVTGSLAIAGSRTEKSYSVTYRGNAAENIADGAAAATYNTNYTFTIPVEDGWAYSLDGISIGGVTYTDYKIENSVCTIPGASVTGDIVISVSKVATAASVAVEGTGAGAAEGYEVKVNIGEDYTLTIEPESGYAYSVTATMDGEDVVVIDNGDNTYTIQKVSGAIAFVVERTVIVDGVAVSEYLTIDGNIIWLVRNATALAEGKVPTYDGVNMYWSSKYDAYCSLVVSKTLSKEEAAEKVDIAAGTEKDIDYGMDVNMTGKVDASDAQLVYNMYNAEYSGFTENVTMEKFLRADVNADARIDVSDAAAIISGIVD